MSAAYPQAPLRPRRQWAHTRTDRLIADVLKILFLGLVVMLSGSVAPFAAGPLASSGAPGAWNSPSDASGLRQPIASEPLVFEPLGPEKARLINQSVPFAPSVGPIARPFVFVGGALSRDRAISCLANAMWYEAGEGEEGQLAVAQVVLNRVRHPAFPNTVCGVVFQGSERRTGCQFTFTCDGAMARRPGPAALAAAEKRAMAMLYGYIYAPVGLATHYHTDWVRPAWSAQMDKLAQVDTHLFFRWHGAWGQAGAMRQAYRPEEPAIAALGAVSLAHRNQEDRGDFASAFGDFLSPGESADANPLPGAVVSAVNYSLPKPSVQKDVPGPLDVNLPSSRGGDGTPQAQGAISKCGTRDFCKLVGRIEGDRNRIAFLYVRDRRGRVERAYWDCDIFPRANGADCLTSETRAWLGYGPEGPAKRL